MTAHVMKMEPSTLKWLAQALLAAVSKQKYQAELQHARIQATSGQLIGTAFDEQRAHRVFVDLDPTVDLDDCEFTIHADALGWAAKNAGVFKAKPGQMFAPVAVITADLDAEHFGTVSIDIFEWDDREAQHVRWEGKTVPGLYPMRRVDELVKLAQSAREIPPFPAPIAYIGEATCLYAPQVRTPTLRFAQPSKGVRTVAIPMWTEHSMRAIAVIQQLTSEE